MLQTAQHQHEREINEKSLKDHRNEGGKKKIFR